MKDISGKASHMFTVFANLMHTGGDWAMSAGRRAAAASAAGMAAAARSAGIAAALWRTRPAHVRPRRFAPGRARPDRRGAASGYDIIKALEAKFQGAYSPSPGAIYPMLQMLEEADLVSSQATATSGSSRSPSRAGPISPSRQASSRRSTRRSTNRRRGRQRRAWATRFAR